eukprot:gene13123-9398_t
MSDAKAKAEARRAKILARDSSKRTVSAIVAGDEDDALYANLGEVKGKERPIAARRSLIRSVSQVDTDAASTASAPNTPKEKGGVEGDNAEVEGETPQKDDSTSNTEDKTEKEQANESSEVAVEPKSPLPKTSEPKSETKLPPPKTLEEIEREVAENTAKFDRTMSFRSNSKLTPERLAQLEQLAQKKGTSSVDPSNLMRLIRLVVIGLLAAYTGYRTAEVSRLEALRPSKLTEIQTVKEFDEFGNLVAEVPVALGDAPKVTNPAEGRTWVGYFQDQYTRRSECTISAVMLAWWIAGVFKRFVNNSQKQQKSKTNIIEQMYNYVNGFQEAALST